MVRLTVDAMVRATSIYNRRRGDESVAQHLRRITHLHLEDSQLDEIGDEISRCKSLLVVYLYDNQLSQIPIMDGCRLLTELHLQNNLITRIDVLHFIPSLQKLYLSGNEIVVLEGLEKLTQLKELFVDHQKLPPGEKLLFEPMSLRTLAKTLEVLDVSGDGLETIVELGVLRSLRTLQAADNRLASFESVMSAVRALGNAQLVRIDLTGNRVCTRKRYREQVAAACPRLESLDGKDITDAYRAFAQNLNRTRDTSNERSSFIGSQYGYGSSVLARNGLGASGNANAPGAETAGATFSSQSSPVRPARELGAPNEFHASPNAGAAAARLYGASVRANRSGSAKHAPSQPGVFGGAAGDGGSGLPGDASVTAVGVWSAVPLPAMLPTGPSADPQPEELQVLSLRPSLTATAVGLARQASSGSPPPPLPLPQGLTALRERAAEEPETVHLPEIAPPARRVSFGPPVPMAPTPDEEAENEP